MRNMSPRAKTECIISGAEDRDTPRRSVVLRASERPETRATHAMVSRARMIGSASAETDEPTRVVARDGAVPWTTSM